MPSIAAPSVEPVTTDPATIQSVYDRYVAGELSAEAAEQYKADVASGRMTLPEGAVIGERRTLSEETIAEVFRRYHAGEFTPQQMADYEADVRLGVMPLPEVAAPVSYDEYARNQMLPVADDSPAPEREPDPVRGQFSQQFFDIARQAGGGLIGGEGVVDIPDQMPLATAEGPQISFPAPGS